MIAKHAQMSLGDLMDIWDEMAATRTYLGLYSIEDANELAFQDVERMYMPQQSMLEGQAA